MKKGQGCQDPAPLEAVGSSGKPAVRPVQKGETRIALEAVSPPAFVAVPFQNEKASSTHSAGSGPPIRARYDTKIA
jgi:hypothetical protein